VNFQNFKDKYEHKKVEEYPNQASDEPLVSVCVLTYNHVNYIKECLDGILIQKTDFPVEILLGEDESSDGTRKICLEYVEKHPDKIRLFLHHRENNIKINGNPTGRFNLLYNFFKAKGKYIAICEGDDYWTDPLKLQKQVDFMEENEECSLCYHPAETTYEDNSRKDTIFKPTGIIKPKKFNLSEFIKSDGLGITTASMVFRFDIIKNLPDWLLEAPYGDASLKLLCGYNGLFGYIGAKPMSLHRRAVPGSWSSDLHSKDWYLERIQNRYLQYDLFNEYSGFEFDSEIRKANKRKKVNILCQMSNYCSRKELAGILIRNMDIVSYFKLKAIASIIARIIFGRGTYNRVLKWIRTKENN
jgi:glycosyltransferase involved in cell wall biosynthesis